MAATLSNMIELGTTAPGFSLYDTVSGKQVTLHNLKGKTATVIMFICNHCPYVKHINHELARLANDYMSKGVSFIGISSNDAFNYPEDSPEKMKAVAQQVGYSFPYLYDETQEVAKAYEAACTPDFFVYDEFLMLRYRGQLDDSRPGNSKPVTGHDLRQALEAILQHKPVSPEQKPSIGCSIKWKK